MRHSGIRYLSVAVALATLSSAFAQNDLFMIGEPYVRQAQITKNTPIREVFPLNQFVPTSGGPAPYIYLSAGWELLGPTASGTFYYFNPGDFATNEWADDVILAGTQAGLPVAHPNSAACLRGITLGIFLPTGGSGGSDVIAQFRIYGWDGSIATNSQYPDPLNAIGNLIWDSGPVNYGPLGEGIWLLSLTLPESLNVVLSKAIYVSFQLSGIPSGGGVIISTGNPGNVYMWPSRGDFRRKTPAGRFAFLAAPQGSFLLALRGTHNFVGQVDLGALAPRSQPRDPIGMQFAEDINGDTVVDGDVGLLRNLVEVEYNRPFGLIPSYAVRFTTYLDEKGRFTLPVQDDVSANVDSITVRFWHNGIKVVFNRPPQGWSTDPCNPTVATGTFTFGDVNGDGIIDDSDLLAVLFGFGSGE